MQHCNLTQTIVQPKHILPQSSKTDGTHLQGLFSDTSLAAEVHILVMSTSSAGRSSLCKALLMGCWRRSCSWRLCKFQQQKLVTVPSTLLLQVLRLRTAQLCCPSAGCPAQKRCNFMAPSPKPRPSSRPRSHTSGRAAAHTTFVLHAGRWVAGLAATGLTVNREATAATMIRSGVCGARGRCQRTRTQRLRCVQHLIWSTIYYDRSCLIGPRRISKEGSSECSREGQAHILASHG